MYIRKKVHQNYIYIRDKYATKYIYIYKPKKTPIPDAFSQVAPCPQAYWIT